MPSTATRLVTLILLLQRRPNQKAAELAASLGVSVRQLHRYIGMLEEMGIPIYSERGPYGGFSLVRGYKLPPLVFTPEEAVALYLGAGLVEEMWGRLFAEAAAGALAKLDSVLPDPQRAEAAWARRTLVATGLHRTELGPMADRLEALRTALHDSRRARLRYRGRPTGGSVGGSVGDGAGKSGREVDFYALVLRNGWWYGVGYCHLRQAVRTFRVDRIERIELLDATFERPASFDLAAYLGQEELWGAPPVRVQMRFFPAGAALARYQRGNFERFEEQPDGSILVELRAADLTQAAVWVLSYGGLAAALSPPEVVETVREWAAALVELHSPPQR